MKLLIQLIFFQAMLIACSTSNDGGTTSGNPVTPIEDKSSSGVVAESIGGALTASSANGASAMMKRASSVQTATATLLCPTYKSASGNGCTQSGSSLWLNDSDCNFGASSSVWNGVQALTMSAGTATCGTFPNPGSNHTLSMQYVTAVNSTTTGTMSITTSFGTQSYIDDHTADLGNFNGDTISPILNGSYGAQVGYSAGGLRATMVVAHRSITPLADHSISGNLTINESAGAISRQVTGSFTVYHNGLRVIGTSTFSGLVHQDDCCLPISGTITTAFRAGTAATPTTAGALFVGKSESLTFTGCGTANLTAYDGSVTPVTLSRCF